MVTSWCYIRHGYYRPLIGSDYGILNSAITGDLEGYWRSPEMVLFNMPSSLPISGL